MQASGVPPARRVRKHSTAHPARMHAGLALPTGTHPAKDPTPALRLRFAPPTPRPVGRRRARPLRCYWPPYLCKQSVSTRLRRRSPPPAECTLSGPEPDTGPKPGARATCLRHRSGRRRAAVAITILMCSMLVASCSTRLSSCSSLVVLSSRESTSAVRASRLSSSFAKVYITWYSFSSSIAAPTPSPPAS